MGRTTLDESLLGTLVVDGVWHLALSWFKSGLRHGLAWGTVFAVFTFAWFLSVERRFALLSTLHALLYGLIMGVVLRSAMLAIGRELWIDDHGIVGFNDGSAISKRWNVSALASVKITFDRSKWATVTVCFVDPKLHPPLRITTRYDEHKLRLLVCRLQERNVQTIWKSGGGEQVGASLDS